MHKMLLKIATFNVRYGTAMDGRNSWKFRKRLLFKSLGDMNPDIMGLQECLPFQVDEIKENLPSHEFIGLGRFHGVPADEIHEHLSGEHCSIMFKTERLKLQKCGTCWHSDTPDIPGSMTWGNNIPRITTWGIFGDRKSNRRFVMFNTHFHWDEPYVTNATWQLIKNIEQIAGDMPVVLTGDFNLGPESTTHKILTGKSVSESKLVFKDIWEAVGKQGSGSGTSHSFSGKPENRIDWILVSEEFLPLSVDRIIVSENGIYPSDHFPLVAKVR